MKRNQAVLEEIRGMACLICATPPPSDPDHITTRGAGGKDEKRNLAPLCRWHHALRHQKGLGHLVKNFPQYRKYLIEIGREDVLERVARPRRFEPLSDSKPVNPYRKETK